MRDTTLVARLAGPLRAVLRRDSPGAPGRGRVRRFSGLGRGSGWLMILLAGLAALVVVAVSPRPVATPQQPLVVASLPYWNITGGTSNVLAHQQAINEVSPWMYGLGPDSRIIKQYPPEQADVVEGHIERLRDAGIPIVPSLANITEGVWTYEPVARMLHDPEIRQRHIAEIVRLVVREDYEGIDVDYENLRASDRAAFTRFVTELAAALHEEDKILSVAVFAKDSDAGYDERNVAQDYAAIGRVADQVRLMGYDRHWATSEPGPVAPIGWIRDVLRYARTQIPDDRIVLGIPLYGYDWVEGGRGEPLTWLQALRLTREHNAQVRYDTESQSPWFTYTDEQGRRHEVWFENQASTTAKLDAVLNARIRGVYLWMFGYEDTATWHALRTRLPVED